MNRILVAVDGSDHAKKALDIAASLANQHDSSVVVVHVMDERDMPANMRHWMEQEYAGEIARRLEVLSLQPPMPDDPLFTKSLLSHTTAVTGVVNTLAGERTIKEAASRLKENGVKSVQSYLLDGDPAETIIEASGKYEAGTIVMGCRGAGRIRGLLLGSVSQAVVHEADCSVILVK